MGKLAITLLGLALAPLPLQAQSLFPDSVFDHLVGRWVLQGTIARHPTTHDVTFERLLGSEYLQMHEVSREKTKAGAPAYEAIVLFSRDPQTGEFACLWLDNTGVSGFRTQDAGRGRVAGDSLPFLFEYTAIDHFHTTFVYHAQSDS